MITYAACFRIILYIQKIIFYMKNVQPFVVLVLLSLFLVIQVQGQQLFRNEKAPMEARVNDLLKALTLKEKIAMLGNNSPAVDRLNIPAYNWWNESLHGLARAGEA